MCEGMQETIISIRSTSVFQRHVMFLAGKYATVIYHQQNKDQRNTILKEWKERKHIHSSLFHYKQTNIELKWANTEGLDKVKLIELGSPVVK